MAIYQKKQKRRLTISMKRMRNLDFSTQTIKNGIRVMMNSKHKTLFYYDCLIDLNLDFRNL